MAGLLNLIPRYLPRYGMAPEWAGAVRPLVLVLTGTAFLITWIFDADVDAQGGAYATGVLVLITSAAVAVTLAARRAGQRRATIGFALVTAGLRLHDRRQRRRAPDGVKIGGCFILAIIVVSLASRLRRVLRAAGHRGGPRRPEPRLRPRLRAAHDPAGGERGRRPRPARSTPTRSARSAATTTCPLDPDVIFVEVTVADPSDFAGRLEVHGEVLHGQYRVMTLEASSVPNALAALVLAIRDETGVDPAPLLRVDRGQPGLRSSCGSCCSGTARSRR